MAVADVPASELVGLDATCSHCLPVLMLCLLLALDFLHDCLHERGGVLIVEKETGSCHCFVFHAVSIDPRTLIVRCDHDTLETDLSPMEGR